MCAGKRPYIFWKMMSRTIYRDPPSTPKCFKKTMLMWLGWNVSIDVHGQICLLMIHWWCWRYWRLCAEGDALKVMHWRWCTEDDALKIMHWRWCTCKCFSMLPGQTLLFMRDETYWRGECKTPLFKWKSWNTALVTLPALSVSSQSCLLYTSDAADE